MSLLIPRPLEISLFLLNPRIKLVPTSEKTLNSLTLLENAGPLAEVCDFHPGTSFGNDLDHFPRSLGLDFFIYPLCRGNPNNFLQFYEEIHRNTQDLVISENLFKSLTCDDLELFPPKPVPLTPQKVDPPKPPLSTEPKYAASEEELGPQEYAPRQTPWLLGGILFMGLDSYFP
ncbi:hypothetical protein DSO57_1017895 [Entomophthora muscae]|uniref:Uncharacterized protein n=1 Tax=Entomophthora muscae TaxID=34485 RepID=A0ACC2UPU4_9FUNG|nr:hypothetical protein DSO57_1017895 [Entomophthora muscae]